MQPIALEETWDTKSWEDRIFAFVMALTAANAQYAYKHFGNRKSEPVLEFRRKLAKDLIYNQWVPEEESDRDFIRTSQRKKAKNDHCELRSLPKFAKFHGKKIVKAGGEYNKWRCSCGKMRTRTYCKCNPGIIYCPQCFATHCLELERAQGS